MCAFYMWEEHEFGGDSAEVECNGQLCSSPNSYLEALSPHVMVFGDGPFEGN